MTRQLDDNHWPFLNYELPRLNKLSSNLYGASFYLMKLLPARYILQKAYEQGKIKRGSRIFETTSGTFGLALAMLSAVKGYKLKLISDPVIDKRLYNRLKDLGTQVEIISIPHPTGGFQQARLDRLNELLNQNPDAFCPNQYSNVYNPKSYAKVGQFIMDELNCIDYLVGPVGSGGSMVGTATFLREYFPNLKVIGVDTCNSILFGQKDGTRKLRGLGNSIMPPNLNHTIFDFVSWVPAGIAFKATRMLHQNHGLYMGGTSGAAYLVGNWIADKYPNKKVVTFFPDEGHRYIDTIYNDQWLKDIPRAFEQIPNEPKIVSKPRDDEESWTIINWNRQSIENVMNEMKNEKLLKSTI